MTRNDKSHTLSPQQEEIIRLCRRPDPDGQDALMLLLWERREWQFRVTGSALCQLGQSPADVSGEGGVSVTLKARGA